MILEMKCLNDNELEKLLILKMQMNVFLVLILQVVFVIFYGKEIHQVM